MLYITIILKRPPYFGFCPTVSPIVYTIGITHVNSPIAIGTIYLSVGVIIITRITTLINISDLWTE